MIIFREIFHKSTTNMRQAVIYCAAGLLLLYLSFSPFAVEGAPTVSPQTQIYLDGVVLLPQEFEPILVRGEIMLPLRAMSERMGLIVQWDHKLKMVTLHGKGRDIALYPGNPLYALNGLILRMNYLPLLKGGRTFVGLDFLEEAMDITLHSGDMQKGALYFVRGKTSLPDRGREGLPNGERELPLNFVELLLPEDKVKTGDWFDIQLAAPFVEGIFAYEITFAYDPAIIQLIDVRNPDYWPLREHQLKEIDNEEGMMRYTLTTLGYRETLPPRDNLAILEVVVFEEGFITFNDDTFTVQLLDNRGRNMSVGLEERILTVEPKT